MSKEYSFATLPSVSISRSRFARKSQHKTTFNLGNIVPVYCDEVLPGDTRSVDLAALVRMTNPIAPIMDNIYLDLYAFFVPARLTWEHWKDFMGENRESAGIPSRSYSIPYLEANDQSDVEVGSYADYFGLPVGQGMNGVLDTNKVSALPFRGLALIYNRWFRNQNLIAPLAVQTGDANEVIIGESVSGTGYGYSHFACDASAVLKASKLKDYFTSSLPYAQKGAPVTIPLGTTAPIITTNVYNSVIGKPGLVFLNTNNDTISTGTLGNSGTGTVTFGTTPSGASVAPANLVADLSQATAATINQLRYAFQLQKLLEKDALYGTRYYEILKAHFGVSSPDSSLQDPEYLGGHRININIDQVLQTTGATGSASSTLGTPGANSVTGERSSIFTKSFTEHGYIYILAVARHDSTYGQGINRMWTRQGRYDFYFPVFANLGAQAVKNKEIFVSTTTTSTDDNVFGYQEAWAEYRFKPSIATGLLRPSAPGSLNYWTLAEDFAATPTLSKSFVEQGRSNLTRALVTSSVDFIADFYFMDVAVRPMPMYSIPGLIDHH